MPLRSVEAASRDDAIAAAREQFGPTARVVGVRRVRSGGVLGFFATERYVAEVDADHPAAPALTPSPSTGEPARPPVADRAATAAQTLLELLPDERAGDQAPADAVSEIAGLLGHAPAGAPSLSTYSPASVSRAAAERPEPARFQPARSPRAARPAAPAEPTTSVAALLKAASGARHAAPVAPTAEPAAPAREEAASSRVRRGATAAPAPWTRALARADEVRATAGDDEETDAPSTGASPSPSPFTAALARMVSGDRDVRQAVQQALDDRDLVSRHEEEPVTEQDTGAPIPGSKPLAGLGELPVDRVAAASPSWEEPAPSTSSREEAIAEVLREALAQGHSDEAIAGILRKVLAGASPQEALTGELPVVRDEAAEPAVAARPEVAPAPVTVLEVPSVEGPSVEVPSVEVPEPVLALVEETVAGPRLDEAPIRDEAPVPEEPPADEEIPADAPLWAEVVLHEPAAVPAPRAEAEPLVTEPLVTESAAAESAATESPATESPAADSPAAEATEIVEEPVAAEAPASVREELIGTGLTGLARTASDPAPMPLDATAVLPPLSLLPPLPGGSRRGSGLPPVPPRSRPPVPLSSRAAAAAAEAPAEEPAGTAPVRPLATVVRLPVALLEGPAEKPADEPAAEIPAPPAAPAAGPKTAPMPAVQRPASRGTDIAGRLRGLGVPALLLGPAFAAEAAVSGTYAALTRVLSAGLPSAPEIPAGPGEVLFIVGPGVETLRAARALAATLRLDPDRVQWATRGELSALAPKGSRMTTIAAAMDRRQDAAGAGMLTIVAVDAPLRADTYWMSQMLAIWAPAAVWAVVDATRKPEDVEPWLDGLPRVDALMVQDSDLSADPAAVLDRIAVPVALLDGVPATPHRWASVLCERLEKHPG